MSAIQSYIDLRFAVSDHVGNRAISDVFPRLVQMAEADFNQRLRTRYQITDATLTFEDGVSPLPPDFLELIEVSHRPGMKRRYQIDGFNITIPGISGDLDVQFYAKIPTLTCSPTACNWLLAQFPSVYLYGVGLQAAKHLRDVELSQATDQLYGYALDELKVADERARWSASVVRVQGCTP